jgi:mannose-6-phosphate isomerase
MATRPAAYRLKGKVQHYSWGGYEFIPRLLGVTGGDQPSAEYWLGAHPSQPATVVVQGTSRLLPEWIATDPGGVLGKKTAASFNGLPFLLKVLDVRQMLSIQVHPEQAAAAQAFEEENQRGIPLHAPHRNYKDTNHKPELMVALSDFWLLHGFKPAGRLAEILSAEPDLNFLLPAFEGGSYEGLYRTVMELPQAEVNRILEPVLRRIGPLYRNGELRKSEEDFWAARAAETFCRNGQIDRGIFSIYLFNLLHLKKGQGIYQPAGLPHAYLEGQNVEIMADSDNVLRAGLTDKHIDIAELMKHVRFEPTEPAILNRQPGPETVYKTAASEFALSAYEPAAAGALSWFTSGPEIILIMQGEIILAAGGEKENYKTGDAAFVTAGAHIEVQPRPGALFFRAAVPA